MENTMEDFILQLGSMSVQATIAMGIILIARLLFVRFGVSKKYANLLWFIPYFCMICPWKLKSPFGFWESRPKEYQVERIRQAAIYIQNATSSVTAAGEMEQSTKEASVMGAVTDSVSMVWTFSAICGTIWLVGVLTVLAYSILSYFRLKRKLICSICVEENIYLADDIETPFVFGLIRPKIYLPSGMDTEYLQYVTEHERTHIGRLDPVKKMLAFFITCIHWFNPFVWLIFLLFGKDMEMACDEETIERIGADKRKEYAYALLRLSAGRRILLGAPLAFGEGSAKDRIKNIIKYKKTLSLATVSAVLIFAVLAACLFTRREGADDKPEGKQNTFMAEGLQDEGSGIGEFQWLVADGTEKERSDMGKFRQLATGGLQDEGIELMGEAIRITPLYLGEEYICGADGPILDYGDERILIFHDYYGLFVYNIEAQRMTGALDLAAIGCQYTQGDNYCEVIVESNGSKVYMHPNNEEDMYVLDVENYILTKQKYSLEGVQAFDELKLTRDSINTDVSAVISNQCVALNSDGNGFCYLYLASESGMVVNLRYVIGTSSKELQSANLFTGYNTNALSDNGTAENGQPAHREGFREAVLHLHIPRLDKESGMTEDMLPSEEEREAMAQQALRELYDLTGTLIKECYYYSEPTWNSYRFALTEDDMNHDRIFLSRCYSGIQSIYISSRRRLWYSPIDMFISPENYEKMSEEEKAIWFVTHAGNYNGKRIVETRQPYEWDKSVWHVIMEDDTAYEVALDSEINSIGDITGPYPDSDIRH